MTPAEGLLKRLVEWDRRTANFLGLQQELNAIIAESRVLLSRAPQGQECCLCCKRGCDIPACDCRPVIGVAALKAALAEDNKEAS